MMAVEERKGIDEAKRLLANLSPYALVVTAAWLNASLKLAAETGDGPPMEALVDMEKHAVEALAPLKEKTLKEKR